MPKIIGGSLLAHREQTRHKIFAALTELMKDRGFDAISLADIAAAAGVGRTAIYNHFPDKEAVLLGLITHETEQYVATLERAIADVEDPVEQLRTYVRQHAQLSRVFHVMPGPDLRSVISRDSQEKMRAHVELVEGVLRRILRRAIELGAIPDQDLDVTVPLINASLATRNLPAEGPARQAAVAATETFLLRAVGAPA